MELTPQYNVMEHTAILSEAERVARSRECSQSARAVVIRSAGGCRLWYQGFSVMGRISPIGPNRLKYKQATPMRRHNSFYLRERRKF